MMPDTTPSQHRDIGLRLTTASEAYIIKNLYPLYLHDLAEHYGSLPNIHGIFEDEDTYRTLQEQYHVQQIWWEKPDILFPYLITADGLPAGFALIASPPHCDPGIDYLVNEFFVLRPFREQGTGNTAARMVFSRLRGHWMLYTNVGPKNAAAQRFWRRTVADYTDGSYTESTEDIDGDKLVFRFRNTEDRV